MNTKKRMQSNTYHNELAICPGADGHHIAPYRRGVQIRERQMCMFY